MTNTEFQESVRDIIRNDISEEGIVKLEKYAELFIEGKLLYKRFSPREQHGCSEGGATNVIASIIAGAENPTDTSTQGEQDFKGLLKSAERQAVAIEKWARAVNIWIDDIDNTLSSQILLICDVAASANTLSRLLKL